MAMGWSLADWFGTPNKLFKRPEENGLMLEQYLAGLEGRYATLRARADAAQTSMLDEAGKVIERYREFRATKSSANPEPLPEWNEAFLADQLLTQLLAPEEARAELAAQLAALKTIDAGAHTALSIEWEGIKNADDQTKADKRVSALLVSAMRAAQWKNTQRWIIRILGTQYAARLRNAFLVALLFGLLLVVFDAYLGPKFRNAAVSGLGFAAAAGLLGASFSAMVGQSRISELDNIEEARAATSRQMIALRLGVGVAAAIILYFFFESGLVEGALFPDLQQIGFGWVVPIGSDDTALRTSAQTLDIRANALIDSISSVQGKIDALTAAMKEASSPAANAAAEVTKAGLGEGAKVLTDPSIVLLQEKLQETQAELKLVNAGIEALQEDWVQGGRPLGRLTPNPDLSKLVVWCFAAGFTQTLVPSMLAKVAPQEKAS
jgi:hypothetical protein